jgi:cellobiose phosphorylase
MGTGDWNDGMNRVGRLGVGESVWLGWFLARTLKDFIPVASARGDYERAERCRVDAQRVIAAIEQSGWDGDWYRRASFDDGTPIGSRESQDCRIDAIAQSWSVIAGGNEARARRAVASSEAELVLRSERLMQLLTPPFTSTEHDPGYIRSYPAGIRENGGQYTHGVLWTVQALCLLGEGERAHELFALLNPISHASDPASVKTYRVEPYVLAADVYSSPEHLGRGGWTWYTGSASWMYRIAVENMLGLKRQGQNLLIAPCVNPSWSEFRVVYRYGRSELALEFDNRSGVASGVRSIELDGKPLADSTVPLIDDGRRHRAVVLLGTTSSSSARSSLAAESRVQGAE